MQLSRFVNANEILNLLPTNRALLQIFTTFDTSSIMLAWQVHAVLVVVAADHTGIGVRLVFDQTHLYLADVSLVRTNLEHCLLLDLKHI